MTVYADSTMFADVLATTLMVLGVERGLSVVESLSGVECLMEVRGGHELRSYSSIFNSIVRKSDKSLVH